VQAYKDAYPELIAREAYVRQCLEGEEQQFAQVLDSGVARVEELIASGGTDKRLTGETAFSLYDTFGFPLELTEAIAGEKGWSVDRAGYAKALEQQRERSRRSSKMQGDIFAESVAKRAEAVGKDTVFLGYELLSAKARVRGLFKGEEPVQEARAGDTVLLVADQTPCYGESGGQAGDTGVLNAPGLRGILEDTRRSGNTILHYVRVEEGSLRAGAEVELQVNLARRQAVRRAHTATHLLHAALREVLGGHASQCGSVVEPDRLRFDFNNPEALSPEQIHRIEQRVNQWIWQNDPVETQVMSLEDARKSGALAFFGEKYAAEVRVLSVGEYSKEFCGGTHASRSGDIGFFRIISEGSVAAGIRRIDALTAQLAFARLEQTESLVAQIAQRLKVPQDRILDALEDWSAKLKELASQRRQSAGQELESIAAGIADQIQGRGWVVQRVEGLKPNDLRVVLDKVRERAQGGVALLASVSEGSAQFVTAVWGSPFKESWKANELAREFAQLCDGKGGGKPDLAQGGTKQVSGLDQALLQMGEKVQGRIS
ncbi:MAG: alanine--tRNA ligase, partial [Candidatus Omnitrophica bacterium]|nr:alanine--tRNA ligase [Candidatus Omnitrophota bacterium]